MTDRHIVWRALVNVTSHFLFWRGIVIMAFLAWIAMGCLDLSRGKVVDGLLSLLVGFSFLALKALYLEDPKEKD